MPNVLGSFNPIFYATNALRRLTTRGDTARRIYSAVPSDRSANARGQITTFPRPLNFEAQERAEGGTTEAQDAGSQDVSITLSYQPEVKYKASDRQRAYSGERLIREHINPAANALMRKINQITLDLMRLRIGPNVAVTAAPDNVGTYITMARREMAKNEAPVDEGNLHFAVDGGTEAAFLGANIWTSAEQTGPGANTTLFTGSLGVRYGYEVYPERLLLDGTTYPQLGEAITDTAAAVNGAQSLNSPTLTIDGVQANQAFVVGDRFTIDGDTTVYTVMVERTFAGTGGTLSIYPALQKNTADNADVTLWSRPAPFSDAGGYRVALAYHREAVGIVYAELPDEQGRGVNYATVRDPQTGIAIRTRMWDDGNTGDSYVALDALIGVEVLNGNLGCVVARSATVNA